MPACGPHQCEDRLNGTPQAGLTWQEGPRWRASARPSWRRLTRPKGTAAVTHGPRISRCRESRAPLAAAWLRRGGIRRGGRGRTACRHRAGRGGGSSRRSQSQPGHLALIDSQLGTGRSARVKDQLTSITIFRLRRRLRRQPTGWHTERRFRISALAAQPHSRDLIGPPRSRDGSARDVDVNSRSRELEVRYPPRAIEPGHRDQRTVHRVARKVIRDAGSPERQPSEPRSGRARFSRTEPPGPSS